MMQPLPSGALERLRRPLERWRDERRRSRKRLPQLQAADVVFASHAKSGRTWVRVMMSHVFYRVYGTPERELLDFDNFHQRDERIPRVFFTSDYNEPTVIRRALPELVRNKRLLLLVRDPRDVAVSYYFHHAKRSTERVRRRLGLPDDVTKMSVADFVLHPRFGVASVIDFMNRWHQVSAAHPAALVQRYEDFRATPADCLAEAMRFLGCPAPDADIAAAVEFASFEALREKERQRFFESERIQPRDGDDPDSFKVRRGKVGGYRDYFSVEQIARVDRLIAETLSPVYGYATDPT